MEQLSGEAKIAAESTEARLHPPLMLFRCSEAGRTSTCRRCPKILRLRPELPRRSDLSGRSYGILQAPWGAVPVWETLKP